MNQRSNSKNTRNQKNEPEDQKGQYCCLVGSFVGGFLALDNKFNIIFCSKESLDLLQSSTNQLIGKNFWEVSTESPNLNWLRQYQHNVKNAYVFVAKEFIPTHNIWLEVKFSPCPNGFSVYINDITNHELMGETMQKAKSKFLRLFDTSPVPQWVYDIDTLSFLEVNGAAVYQYGYSREEFLAMTIKEIRPKSEHNVLEELLKQRANRGLYSSIAAVHRLKSGEIRHVKIESSTISFRGHKARLVLALDFNEQYLAQEALKNSERRFRALVQDGSDLIAVLDKSWCYKYVNDSSKTILNLDPEFLIGKNPFDFIHPEDKQRVMAALAALNKKKRMEVEPFRFIDGNGNFKWIATILTDMTNEENIGGIIANSRDVTEIIADKIKIQKSMERYDIVSKATSDAIWDWDLLSNEITWNSGIKKIFGYENMIYNAEWYRSKIHPEDLHDPNFQKYLDSLAKGKSRKMAEFRFKCADGSYKAVLDRSFVIFDSDKKPIRVIGSMQDITHTNNYINAIEQQNKKLQEISWLQSHAVRAPLASVLGLTQLIQFPKYADDDLVQLLKYVKSSAEELDTVITNIIKKTYE